MQTRSELRYLMALQRVSGLGDISIRKLIRYFGNAKTVLSQSKTDISKVPGIIPTRLESINADALLKEADAEIEFTLRQNIQILTYYDPEYPAFLKHCPDAPILLFVKGKINLHQKNVLSVVGTRNITPYGRKACEDLISGLAPLNPVIISGFAYGVDITAHKCALEHGLQTIACMAHGLNQCYPKQHARYEEAMIAHGGFITEFWSTDAFDKNNFLRRNRIIAGISEATLVVESAEKGGSLVTADIANSYSRDVYAVPGKISDRFSKGCNDLIKTQKAQLVDSSGDLLFHLGWTVETGIQMQQQQFQFFDLNNEEDQLYQYINTGQKHHFDTLLHQLGWQAQQLAAVLFQMELKGIILPLPGKFYKIA